MSKSENERKLVLMKNGDIPIKIDPQCITHAFITLSHDEMKYQNIIQNQVQRLNRACQPDLWNVPFQVKCIIFTADKTDNGYPDVSSIPKALERIGLEISSSIVINNLTVSLDGKKSHSNIYCGFAYYDTDPKMIFPYNNGCLPINN